METGRVTPGHHSTYKGNTMRAYSNMPTYEFVGQLRDIAIRAKASPLVIDQIDAIVDAPSEEDIEERESTARDAGIDKGRETQWEICCDALSAGMVNRKGKPLLGLTEDQIQALSALLQAVRPQR